jgi:hypothetical protein
MVGRCVEIIQVLVPPGGDNDDVHAHTHHGGTPPVHAVAPLYDHTLARLHNRYHHQDGARCRDDQPDTEDYRINSVQRQCGKVTAPCGEVTQPCGKVTWPHCLSTELIRYS